MKAILACLLFPVVVPFAIIESNGPASIKGTVTADSLTLLSGVTIGVDAQANGFHRQASSDVSGKYLIGDLRPGAYSVWAEASGYGCIIYPSVALFRGQSLQQDFNFVRAKASARACESELKKKKK